VTEHPRVSVVIPAKDEGESIVVCLDRVFEGVTLPCEVLVVVDSPADATLAYLEKYAQEDARLVPTINTVGPGPAAAIRFGISRARADVVVVTMADGCDDAQQIDQLTRLVERGVVIAAASRYSRGGQQVGVPSMKRTLSKLSGLSLHWLARVGTHDATNSFKAYSRQFIDEVGIDSDAGFEMGIELVAKARRLRRGVAEIPTIWLDRRYGVSNFKLAAWLPRYLRWYRFAFGPRLTTEQLRAAVERSRP
jgi:dolichol-phosphate mannosyltransferase